MRFLIFIFLSIAALFYPLSGHCGESEDFSRFFMTVYDGRNGLPDGIANDIDQTKDGVLWIGTYGGLYRTTGSAIEWMGDLKEVKTVNCLYSDEAGRLWIGTNDNGVSIFMNQEISNTLNKSSGLPSNSVRSIVADSEGRYYVGTTDSLVIVTLNGGLKVTASIPQITYARSLSANGRGLVSAVSSDGKLFLVKGDRVLSSHINKASGEVYNCAVFSDSGILYAGTQNNRINVFRITEDFRLEKIKTIDCDTLRGINSINIRDDGGMIICSDSGVGYVDYYGVTRRIETGSFRNSVENMITDCQGNLWFTSSRQGVLRLTPTLFHDIHGRFLGGKSIVNTVLKWQGTIYLGTDDGLDISDDSPTSLLTFTLLEKFSKVRIRALKEDSRGHLWICTSGKGLFDISPDGVIKSYDSSNGAEGSKFRTIIETNGGFVAAGDSGITFIKDDQVIHTIGGGRDSGLVNPKVLCLMEWKDGEILAGTDGNGIAVIKDGRVRKTLLQKDGLSSEIILKIARDKAGDGAFIITGNGLCYINHEGTIRSLPNFPYYNNFDLAVGGNDKLFVTSSAGIFVTSRSDLLDGKDTHYDLFNAKKGMNLELVPNSSNDLKSDGNWYLAGKDGAMLMNLNHYETRVRSYRMLLETIRVDGVPYRVKKGEAFIVRHDAKRIEIAPEIVNYTVKDPFVSTYLEGVDKAPVVRAQSEMRGITYTNLPPGSFNFHVAVLDSETGAPVSENIYRIVKERDFNDNWWFYAYLVFVTMLITAYLTWLAARVWTRRVILEQKRKLDEAAKQLRMVNETILTIAQTVDAKDVRTSQHSFRVSKYSVMIAKRMGVSADRLENLRQVALLHDIGKIGIPDSVLNKPSRLTDEEYALMKTHVERGGEILKNFTMIDNVAEGALYHHERYDGRGYPRGLKGEEIPLNARIIGIADAFDAMTANRVYRNKLDMSIVIDELKRGRGTQFDPEITDIMLSLIDDGSADPRKMYLETQAEKNNGRGGENAVI